MEKFEEIEVAEINFRDLIDINGGIIPAVIAGAYATKALCAMYGTAKVAGAVTGAVATIYVALD